MEVAVVILAIALLVLATAIGILLLRRDPASTPSVELVPVENPVPAVRSESTNHGGLVLHVGDRLLATLDLEAGRLPEARAVPAGTLATTAILELARTVPEMVDLLRTAGPRLTFSRETIRGIADGSLQMMTGDHAVAVDAMTKRAVEIGKVTSPTADAVSSIPLLLTGGVAIAAATLQQQQLGAALSRIDDGIDAVYQRHIDDDTGRLHAGAALAGEVIRTGQRGQVPPQLATELAFSRRDIDAIYFARREQMRRFIEAIEMAQNAHEERHGEAIAWAKGVRKALGEPGRFEADALAFVRAATVKAHLAASTAAVVAAGGAPDHAFEILDDNETLLRTDVLDLQRRLTALAANRPERFTDRLDSGEDAYNAVSSVVRELEQRIEPLLPLEAPDAITIELDTAVLRRELGPSG